MNAINPMQTIPRLLIIDDDRGITELIKEIAEDMEYTVNCVHDYESIGGAYRNFQPDIIFLDLRLPGHDGVEVLHYLAEVGCEAKIFLMSGLDRTTLTSAGEVGRLNHLNIIGTQKKPFLIEDIQRLLLDDSETSSRFTSEAFQNLFGAGEFCVLFQPCMAIKTLAGQGLSDVDISVNWYGQAGASFLSPDQYLPQLETADLVLEFGCIVLETVLEIYKAWMDRGLDFGLVVRLQDSLFHDNALPDCLLHLSSKYSVSPKQVTIGISENKVLSKSTAVLDVLTRLRINGFNISSEISNGETAELERLLHLPISELRLNKALTNSVAASLEAEFNVSTLISMCNKHGLLTRADGICDEATLKSLFEYGCTSGLGDFFSAPLNIHDLERFISQGEQDQQFPTFAAG